ncbi:glycosyl hydrolase family protein [Silvibacterium acidisoli]|uniref:glycosyl hydrolase family protein n=1 Tax=Acidobacteriaceae bacterium ZG23-2 TaxID=2883246 RepID=UPI00406C31C4
MRLFVRLLPITAAFALLFPTCSYALPTNVAIPGSDFIAAAAQTVAAPSLSFSASGPSAVEGTPGSSVFSFTTGGSFQGNVALSISGLPVGVTAGWNSSLVTISGGKGTATLTVTPSVSVAAGVYPFTVTASGSGLTVSHSFNLTVKATAGIQVPVSPSVTMQSTGSASSSFTAQLLPGITVAPGAPGCVATLASTLPTGVTATAGTPTLSSSGTVSFPFTLTGSPQAIAWSGRFLVKFQVTDAKTGKVFSVSQYGTLTITYVKPTLTMTPSTTQIYVTQGSTAADNFSFTGGGSFYGAVKLTATGLASGLTGAWNQNPLTLSNDAGVATLSLTASSTATPGTYSFSVAAAGDSLNIVSYLRVTVLPTIGVQLQVSQSLVNISPSVASNVSVTATTLNPVSVSSTGSGVQASIQSALPAGVIAKFGTPVITNSGKLVTWPLTLTLAAGALSGIYPVTAVAVVTDQASGFTFSSSQSFSIQVAQLASVSVGTTPGPQIQPDFMGLSHEWGNLYRLMGSQAVGVNQIYRQMLQNLTINGSSVNVRMGGNSTDVSTMPTADTDEPLAELAAALHNKLILGINLGSDEPSLALAQAENDAAVMPPGSIEALEIGNEPDEYFANGMRASTYTFSDYLTDYNQWSSAISPVLPPGTGFAAPAWASTVSLTNLPAFLASAGPSLSVVAQHYYGGSPTSNPAPDVLLTPAFATNGPKSMAAAVASSHAAGKKFRVDEIGSFFGAGIPGISNAFESALWAMDTMFEYANVGVDGVNWETSSGNYDSAFMFNGTMVGNVTTYTIVGIYPLYYGMLLFQEATSGNSSLLPTTVTTAANLKCWATVNASGVNSLVIINKDESQSGPVVVSMPGYNSARITRLLATSYQSTSGVTIGGQTFDTTTDGTPQGAQTQETIQGSNGQFLIPVSPTSAVLAVFSK